MVIFASFEQVLGGDCCSIDKATTTIGREKTDKSSSENLELALQNLRKGLRMRDEQIIMQTESHFLFSLFSTKNVNRLIRRVFVSAFAYAFQ